MPQEIDSSDEDIGQFGVPTALPDAGFSAWAPMSADEFQATRDSIVLFLSLLDWHLLLLISRLRILLPLILLRIMILILMAMLILCRRCLLVLILWTI